MTRGMTLLLAVASAAVVGAAGPAFAHAEPQVAELPAGSTQMIPFEVSHGCDGSPTVQVALRVPAGVTSVSAPDKPGWSSTIAADTVTWTGGPLPADDPDTFPVTVTLPETPGVELVWPLVQTCEHGQLAWIETGDGELEYPAPVIRLGPPETSPTPSSPTSTPPSTSPPTSSAAPGSGGGSPPWWWIGAGAAAFAAVAGGGFLLARRRA